MRLQATVSQLELVTLVERLLPLELALGDEDDGRLLAFDKLQALELLPEQGIRLALSGKITWPVLGIDVPVGIESLHVLVRLARETRPSANLVVRLLLEDADLAWVPGAVDRSITERINKELAERKFEGAWDFEHLLTNRFNLPSALRSSDSLSLLVDSSAFQIAANELRLDVMLHAEPR